LNPEPYFKSVIGIPGFRSGVVMFHQARYVLDCTPPERGALCSGSWRGCFPGGFPTGVCSLCGAEFSKECGIYQNDYGWYCSEACSRESYESNPG
jgi:hypothetical protein